eukprot:tig00000498_g1586.t1
MEVLLKSLAAGDIEAGATAMLRFLERVGEFQASGRLPALSDSRALQRAIRRYQKYMTVRQRDTNLLPPMDVAFIWHCHLLNPRDYITSCNQVYFKVVEPYDDVDYAGTGDQEYAEDMWARSFPNEPWDLGKGLFVRDDDSYGSFFACDTNAIHEEALRQVGFMDSLRRRNIPWQSPEFLHNAAVRYMKYLRLAGKYPHVTMVPTKDIDIIWHSHLRRPGGYAQDTENIAGRVLYHNDTIREDELNRMMADTKSLWEQEYHEDYLMGHRANLAGPDFSMARDTSFFEAPPRPQTPRPRKNRSERNFEQRTEVPLYTAQAQAPVYTQAPIIAPGPITTVQPQYQYKAGYPQHRVEDDFDCGTCIYDCLCCNGCDKACDACCSGYSTNLCGPCADACAGCGASCDSCNRGCIEFCPEPDPRVPQIPMPCLVFFLIILGALSLLGVAFGILIDLTGNGDTNQSNVPVSDRTFRIGHMLAGTGAMLFWTTCLGLYHRSRPKQYLFLRLLLFVIGGGAVGGGFALAAYKVDDCYIFPGIIMTTIGSLLLTFAFMGWFLGASTVGCTIPHGVFMVAWGIVILVRANGTKGLVAAPPTGSCWLCPCVYNVNAGIWLVVVGGCLAVPFVFFCCCYYGWASEQRIGVNAQGTYYRTPSKYDRYSNGYTYTKAPQGAVDVYTGAPQIVTMTPAGTPPAPRYNTGYKYHTTPPPPQPLVPAMDINPGTQMVGVTGAAPSMALAGPVVATQPVYVQQPGVSAVNQALGSVRGDPQQLYTTATPLPITYTPGTVVTPAPRVAGSVRF